MKTIQDLHRLYKDQWKSGPYVFQLPANEASTETYLMVHWGSGFGHWGFLVGSPHFRTRDPFYQTVEWIPGLYFFADNR